MKIKNVINLALVVSGALLFGLIHNAVGAPATKPVVPDTYVLGSGDQVEIQVFGEPDLSRTVTIKPDGMIGLPLVNEVKAAGKTTTQLEADLLGLYAKYLKAPSISVSVKDFRVDRVSLLGQVTRPGDYQLRPNGGIFELLAAAGGPTNRADLAKAVVIRGKTETIPLDLISAFAKNKTPDVKLQAGDVVFIPETDKRLVVLGEVTHPGSFDLLEGQHVTDLLAAAGGPTPKAGLSRAFIMRGTEQIPTDLRKVLAGDLEANASLKPGDMLVVPESKDRIAVLGAVNKPGPFDLTENMSVLDALAQAGGPTDKGNLGGLQIVRVQGGKTTTIPIKADKMVQGKASDQNVRLQNGDLVYVPEKGMGFWEIINNFGFLKLLFGF